MDTWCTQEEHWHCGILFAASTLPSAINIWVSEQPSRVVQCQTYLVCSGGRGHPQRFNKYEFSVGWVHSWHAITISGVTTPRLTSHHFRLSNQSIHSRFNTLHFFKLYHSQPSSDASKRSTFWELTVPTHNIAGHENLLLRERFYGDWLRGAVAWCSARIQLSIIPIWIMWTVAGIHNTYINKVDAARN